MVTRYSGKFGKVLVGVTTICITKWKATHNLGEQDVTDTCSNGKGESTGTIERVEFSFEGNWRADQNPYQTPPSLAPTDSGPNVKLYVNKNSTNPTFDMPTTFISSVEVNLDVPGVVTWTVTGKSQGDFTVNANTGS